MKLVVNGLEVPEYVVENELQRARQFMQSAPEEVVKSRVKEQLTRQALIRVAAMNANIAVPPAHLDANFQHFIQQHGGEEAFLTKNELSPDHLTQIKMDMENNIKIELFLEQLTKDAILPAENMLREYHKRDKKLLFTSKRWHVAHIVKNPENGAYEEMCSIRQALLAGDNFAQKANTCSSCQDENGDLGWIEAGQMVPEFEAVAFSMNINEISPVFLTQYGYHIATILGIEEPRETTYEEAEEKVKHEVMMRVRENIINQWIEKAFKTADIQYEA